MTKLQKLPVLVTPCLTTVEVKINICQAGLGCTQHSSGNVRLPPTNSRTPTSTPWAFLLESVLAGHDVIDAFLQTTHGPIDVRISALQDFKERNSMFQHVLDLINCLDGTDLISSAKTYTSLKLGLNVLSSSILNCGC